MSTDTHDPTTARGTVNGVDVPALRATTAALKDAPHLAAVTFTLDSTWRSGCAQDASTGPVLQAGQPIESKTVRYDMSSDEPVALLGTDTAASPAEYVLQGLAGCYAVTLASLAASRDIELDHLAVTFECDIDLQGFLGIDPDVRPGAQQIRASVDVRAAGATDAQLDQLVEDLQKRSPIRDTLANPVDVVTTRA